MMIPAHRQGTRREGRARVRLRLSGGTPREGVRSEARAEQRLAAGGGLPRSAARRAEWAAPPIRIKLRGPFEKLGGALDRDLSLVGNRLDSHHLATVKNPHPTPAPPDGLDHR